MRHASFFSGVGGLDIGFERAGIQTVSLCEVDPYASSVLAERFPGTRNLGDITEVHPDEIPEADIWSGGFPCQDLSRAGKRAGFGGKRSSLAFTFLDLVERRRPNFIVLENVPGLFSSNSGGDFLRLIREMDELGYGVAWRTLDARYFGVAQRRRRVFIVGSLGSDRAAEILFECEGCGRHPSKSREAREETSPRTEGGTFRHRGGAARRSDGAEADPDRMRATDGVSRRMDDQPRVAEEVRVGNFELYDFPKDAVAQSLSARRARDSIVYGTLSFPSRFGSNADVTVDVAQSFAHSSGAPAVFRKSGRATSSDAPETWKEDGIANTLNAFDGSDIRTTHAVIGGRIGGEERDPEGLDSHRYRCCGNGVVANVAEWIGRRLVAVDGDSKEEA